MVQYAPDSGTFLTPPLLLFAFPLPFAFLFKVRKFRGNTMVQYAPDGRDVIYFMHANLQKWHLQLPPAWEVREKGGGAACSSSK